MKIVNKILDVFSVVEFFVKVGEGFRVLGGFGVGIVDLRK